MELNKETGKIEGYARRFGRETGQPGFFRELALRFVVFWTLISRIPLPKKWWPKSAEYPGGADALTMAPLAGGVLGLISALPAWLLAQAIPPAPCAWIACGLYTVAGWSLHLDGWGDLWDGVGSGKKGDAMREVMKDSRSGSFGVAGIVLAISIRASLLSAISVDLWIPACVASGGIGRFATVVSAYLGKYPWAEGMAKDFVDNFKGYQLFCASLAACVLLPFTPFAGWVGGILCAGLAGAGLALWANRELGGTNGDVLGASAVSGELLVLICCAI